MEKWRTVTTITFLIYAFLMSIFYLTTGGAYIYFRNTQVIPIASSSLYQASVYLLLTGSIMFVMIVIQFLWLCNVNCGSKRSVVLASILFDIVFGALSLSVAILTASYTRTFYKSYLLVPNWSKSDQNIYNAGIALTVCSFVGFGVNILVSSVRLQTLMKNDAKVPISSRRDFQ